MLAKERLCIDDRYRDFATFLHRVQPFCSHKHWAINIYTGGLVCAEKLATFLIGVALNPLSGNGYKTR